MPLPMIPSPIISTRGFGMTHPRAFTLIGSGLVPATHTGLRKGRPKPSIETFITSPSCILIPSLKLRQSVPKK